MIQRQKWALLSFEGRMRRRDYWMYSIPLLLLVTPTLFYRGGNTALDLLSLTISLFSIYASIALNIKRLKDRNREVWWIVFTLIPVVGSFYALIDLGILDGTLGDNRYGPDPKGRDLHVQSRDKNDDIATFEG